jgi:SOUL heme-binding protein
MTQSNDFRETKPSGQRRRRVFYGLGATVLLLALAGIAVGPIMSRIEQPKYQVIEQAGSIEIRDYAPMIAAEAEVSGERKAAIGEGFRLIAAYIFGANRSTTKIAMTAPVQQQASHKIATREPLILQSAASDRWTVRFIMPASWTLDTLPQPNDSRVTLHPLPATRMIVIRFSGTANDALITEKTTEVRDYASRHNMKTLGEPLLALYNPPWTLPIFRRNEVMFQNTTGPI